MLGTPTPGASYSSKNSSGEGASSSDKQAKKKRIKVRVCEERKAGGECKERKERSDEALRV